MLNQKDMEMWISLNSKLLNCWRRNHFPKTDENLFTAVLTWVLIFYIDWFVRIRYITYAFWNAVLLTASLFFLISHHPLDLHPDILRELVPALLSHRLRMLTADAIYRNICTSHGLTMGSEPLSLHKIVRFLGPALSPFHIIIMPTHFPVLRGKKTLQSVKLQDLTDITKYISPRVTAIYKQ